MAIAVIVLVAGGIFVNALGADFLWDDYVIIVDNPHVRDLRQALTAFRPGYWRSLRERDPNVGGSYRPVVQLSLAVDYAIWGLNPVGYHVSSIVLHIVNSVLVYLLTCRVVTDRRVSAFAALLFAAHPIHVEAVVWAKARSAPLALLFILISALLYLRWADSLFAPRRAWLHVCALACFALALSSKQSAIALPLLLGLCLWCLLPRRAWGRGLVALLPFVGVTAAFFAVDAAAPHLPELPLVLTPYSHLLTVLATVGFSLRLLVVPIGLCAHHYFAPQDSPLALPVLQAIPWEVALLVGMAMAFCRSRAAFFALAWIAIGMAPLSNLVILGRPIGETRLYAPSVGLCILLAVLLQGTLAIAARRRARRTLQCLAVGVSILLVGTCSALTLRRNAVWADELWLLHDTVANNPQSWLARRSLGMAYERRGLIEEAVVQFRWAVAVAPDDVHSLDDAARLYRDTGRYGQAIGCYERMLGFAKPGIRLRAHTGLGITHARMQEPEAAASHFRDALRIDPGYVDALHNLGALHAQEGEYEKAIAELRRAARLAPDSAPVHHILGIAYEKSGAYGQALEHYREALSIQPEVAQTWLAMGACYQDMGNEGEAVRCYRKCLELGGPRTREAQRRLLQLTGAEGLLP
ncbi:MAG: tetratricopeptide repeat protein [Armatimonadota bacterium]